MYSTTPTPTIEEMPSYYESKNYISHKDSRQGWFEKLYDLIKGVALSRKQKLLLSYLPERGKVLDIGSGTGEFVAHLEKANWKAQGMEPNDGARMLGQKKGVSIVSSLNELNGAFDAITMWHVLEHVYDLKEQIIWLKEHLSKEGYIFLAVPNFESYDAKHYKQFWAAYDVPRHLHHFSKKAINVLFSENGFQLVKTHPMKFDAYYVSLLSEQYKSGSKNVFKALYHGFISNAKARRSGAYSSLIYVLKHK